MEIQSPDRKPLSDINVTPFVDVMLVLLVIFMVTAPMMHQGFQVELPESKAQTGSSIPDDPFIIVIRKDGQVLLGEIKVSLSQLSPKLRAIFKNRKNKQIYLQADKRVYYESVAKVMGEIRSAGLTHINLVTYSKHK